MLHQLHWLPVRHHIEFKVATLVHQSLSGISPPYLADDCRLVADARERRLRSMHSEPIPNIRSDARHTAPLATERSELPAPNYGTVFRRT